jgi:hypothetical protein
MMQQTVNDESKRLRPVLGHCLATRVTLCSRARVGIETRLSKTILGIKCQMF